MPAALSKSQIDKLGRRLVDENGPFDDDLELLYQLLLDRSEQLDRAETRMREAIGAAPTSRMKNTETILEKLRRSGGSGLKSIQDLAGMRIVGDTDRRGQDELVEQIVALFADGDRPPKVVDRRAEPMHGYRAVHVIVFPEGAPIEIQVRTQWQHEWAEFFEKLADLVGRGIRYGEPPTQWILRPTDGQSVQEALALRYETIEALVGWALAVATMIDAIEVAEIGSYDALEIQRYRREVNEDLEEMREALLHVAEMNDTIARLQS
jgi:hypothetical protein